MVDRDIGKEIIQGLEEIKAFKTAEPAPRLKAHKKTTRSGRARVAQAA
jgi:hypothetical protein